MTHQNIQGGIIWAGWARFGQGYILTPVSRTPPPPPPTKKILKKHDFEGSHSKFCAQGPEFLATALHTILCYFSFRLGK